MPRTSLAYRAAVRLGVALAPALALGGAKLRAGVAGRKGLTGRLAAWVRDHRDPARPLLWMHAPSVGEGLQAEAVLTRLRAGHPDWQIAYTWFSPSAVEFARRVPADLRDYLPWDRRDDVDAALGLLRPTALVFSKLDLWPELATRAAAQGARVGLIAATVSPASGRLRGLIRHLLRPGYGVVTAAGAVSAEDAERLARLGVDRRALEVTGDPRYDSAMERLRAVPPGDPLRALTAGGPTLVAGSTWPADEDRLLRAFGVVRARHPDARLVVVPHEPTAPHLARLEEAARQAGLPAPARLSAGGAPAPLVVVDRVGVLAAIYPGARLAYVGGGFGTAGLHSVVEPAACGVPVFFGPAGRDNRDAGLLLQAGGARMVGDDLAERWLEFLEDAAGCRSAGRQALETIEAGLGAAERSVRLVERLMRGG